MHRYLSLLKHPQSRLMLFGTALEYYDYTLYGFCAGLIAQQLFPDISPENSLLKTYLVFCAGSLAKPIGAFIFGWIGDLYGRRIALQWSMLGIVVPTLLIIFIPSSLDNTIAMIIILLARLLQGIFIAGEGDGVRIRQYESSTSTFRFIDNAIIGLSCYIGIFFASQGAMIAQQFPDYWRIPFLIGGILGLYLIRARRHLTESPSFKRPTKVWGKPNYQGLFSVIMLCGAVGGTYHLFFVYQPTYWSSILEITTASQAQSIISICLLFYIPGLLMTAILCEKFRPDLILTTGILGTMSLTPLITVESSPSLPLLCSISLFLSLMHGPGYILLAQQFPIHSRYRHMSIGHSLGSLLMSGTAPLIATYCWQKWHSPFSFAQHFLILAIIGFIGVMTIQLDIRVATRNSAS